MKKNILSIRAVMNSPPPPPPSKRSRKGLIALIIIVIVVVAAVVGAYAVLRNGSDNSNNTSPSSDVTSTPLPTATSTSSDATSTPTTNGVATASSLRFSIDVTSGGVTQVTSTYMAKNVGTNNLMLRIETTENSGTTSIFIINGALQKAWTYDGTEWTDVSVMFSTQYNTYDALFTGYQNNLADWAGTGGWTYTAPNGDSVRYYDISVNPNLADSLFQNS